MRRSLPGLIFVAFVVIFAIGVGKVWTNAKVNVNLSFNLPTPKLMKPTEPSGELKVVRVVDGDTIEVEGGKLVRYIGVNTPETKDPRRSVECFGKEAAEYNKQLVEGKKVRLEKDVSEKDKYGRLLRYVWIDNTLINNELVAKGYAQVATYPPDVKYKDQFLESETNARLNLLGLWKKCK